MLRWQWGYTCGIGPATSTVGVLPSPPLMSKLHPHPLPATPFSSTPSPSYLCIPFPLILQVTAAPSWHHSRCQRRPCSLQITPPSPFPNLLPIGNGDDTCALAEAVKALTEVAEMGIRR